MAWIDVRDTHERGIIEWLEEGKDNGEDSERDR